MTLSVPRSSPSSANRTELACPPRYGTPRNPDRKTLGGKVARVSENLGAPFMPWQRHVADVALELNPDTGKLWYREIIITVPRQSGKTTEILAVAVHRANAWRHPQTIVYTAQTRQKAREKWEEEHVATLKKSAFRGMFRVSLANGREAIRWNNGSRHGLESNTEKAGHGTSALNLAFLDEAFAHEDSRAEQAMSPAMITVPDPQLWVVSTAGTVKSKYLRGKVNAGRELVLSGEPSRTAYFEWSAGPDEDPGDPATWWGCMPALGITVTEDAIRYEYEKARAGDDFTLFTRPYLNWWPEDEKADSAIDAEKWGALADRTATPPDPLALAVDMTPDRSWTSLGVSGVDALGRDVVEVVEHRPGSDWVVSRTKELKDRWNIVTTGLDPAGPAGSLVREFVLAGIDLELLTHRDVVQACGGMYDAIQSGQLVHRDQAQLNAAVAAAVKQQSGDAFKFARQSPVDISPFYSVTFARQLRQMAIEEDYDVADSIY